MSKMLNLDGSKYKQISGRRNIATRTQTLEKGQEVRKAALDPKENDQKPRKPTRTQGPCPRSEGDLCIDMVW